MASEMSFEECLERCAKNCSAIGEGEFCVDWCVETYCEPRHGVDREIQQLLMRLARIGGVFEASYALTEIAKITLRHCNEECRKEVTSFLHQRLETLKQIYGGGASG